MPSRNNMMANGTPLQQSMTRDKSQYAVEDMGIPMLGVILDVRPSDNIKNRSAAEFEDYRGFVPECSVLIVHDNLVLENVLITPDAPSGLDDFHERLPRPSSKLVDGTPLSTSLGGLDPNLLDGDWCIVGFFKGIIDSPYIMRWWPNPNNRYDPATSGRAFPNKLTGEGSALEQSGRYFSRVNGVECVITTEGNVSLSTRFSNSKVDFEPPNALSKMGGAVAAAGDAFKLPDTEGRPSREEREDGGSIRLQVKPSQTLEIDFAPQVDGMGWDDLVDEQLPQTNPHLIPSLPPNRTTPLYSYVVFDSNEVSIDVPLDFKVKSNGEINHSALTAYNIESMGTFDATITTTASLSAASITIAASGPAQLHGATVQLGSSAAAQPLVLGTALVSALNTYALTLGPVAGNPALPVTIGVAQAAQLALATALTGALSGTITGE